MTTPPRDELSSPELLATGRGRLAVAAFVVLALAVVVVAALRPDRQGVGTPASGESPSASALPSPAEMPSPTPELSPIPRKTYGPAPVPPPLTASTGGRLVVGQGTRLELLDVDTGKRTAVRRVAHADEYDRLDVVAVGRELVLVGDNNTGAGNSPSPAYATTNGPGSSLREIGQASYLIPSTHPDRVWLVADVDDNTADSGSTLTEVDLRGVVHVRAHFGHRFGVDPFAGGFLVDANTTAPGDAGDQGTDLVDVHGRKLDHFDGQVRLVSGSTAILSLSNACERDCLLSVLTVGTTVTERTVHLDSFPSAVEFALSPDVARLYASVIDEGGDRPPSHVLEIDLHSGGVRVLRDAWAETYYGPSFVFSADGRWLFFSDVDAKHVDAYELATQRTYRVRGTFATITQLEAWPS